MKRWWRRFKIFLVMVAFVATCSIALATPEEETTETAQAIVDGEVLFEVSSSNQFLAPERANFINEQLQKAAVNPGVESVEVVERNDLPTILLDGIYLMTVTERDSETGRTAREQAEIWADNIRQALQKANRERSQAFFTAIDPASDRLNRRCNGSSLVFRKIDAASSLAIARQSHGSRLAIAAGGGGTRPPVVGNDLLSGRFTPRDAAVELRNPPARVRQFDGSDPPGR